MAVANPRVLVLDADMVPALIVVRSLTARGCTVDLAGHTQHPLGRYSNAPDKILQYPEPLAETKEFVAWLQGEAAAGRYDLIIPVTERTLVPLSRSREALRGIRIAMPSARSLELVLDKSQTMALAEKFGVRVPVGVQVHSIEDVDALIDAMARASYKSVTPLM